MADFFKAYKKTAINEGGYANDPVDAGGMTAFGIARNFWPQWSGWRTVDQYIAGMVKQPQHGTKACRNWTKYLDGLLKGNPSFMTSVQAFYQSHFWDKHRLGEIKDQAVAEWAYDHAVNGGTQGVKWLQEAAAVQADGSVGPATLAAVNSSDPAELLKKAEIVAAWYRIDRVHEKPSQARFLSSWLSRDGVDADIVAQAKAYAKDGLSDAEVEELKGMIQAAA